MILVVGVNDRVQRFDGRKRLHGLIGTGKVRANLLGHGHQVRGSSLVLMLELVSQLVAISQELFIELI